MIYKGKVGQFQAWGNSCNPMKTKELHCVNLYIADMDMHAILKCCMNLWDQFTSATLLFS